MFSGCEFLAGLFQSQPVSEPQRAIFIISSSGSSPPYTGSLSAIALSSRGCSVQHFQVN